MGTLWIVQFCMWGALFCDSGRANMIGTKFITTYLHNGPSSFNNQKKEIRLTGTEDKTDVTVEAVDGSYSRSLTIGKRTTISMPLTEYAENRDSVRIVNAVLISSNKPISVISMNARYKSAETTAVLPLSALGTEYFAITPTTGASDSFKVCAVIASTEETSVEIHTKGSVQVDGKRYAANSVFKVTLPAFQGIQMLSADDLSGSQVLSAKPVALLCGHTCALKNTQCNHVYEQLLPVSRWTDNYLVVPLSFQQNIDLVSIIAAGKTEVNYFLDTINKKENMVAGQVLEIKLSNKPLRIEASDGVQVTYFNTGGISKTFEYNPFLMNIMGIDDYCSSYYLYGQRGIDNYAIIIAESSSTADIIFDGRPLYNPKWTAIPGTIYSWVEQYFGNSLTSHRVEHPSKKFGLQSVGIGSMFSYGALGTCLKDPGPPPPSCRDVLCPPRQVCIMESGKPKCVKPQLDFCWASGDPHLCTWDKRYFDFMGTCTYTFATVCGDVKDLPKFTIQTKHDNRGNVRVSYVGQVTFITGPHTIVAKKGEFGHVRVDNALRQLPISLINGTLKLFQSGNSVVTQLGDDVQLTYDWNHFITAAITRKYAGKMCGLCGNYNQNPKDDFQTPGGTLAPNTIAFGASWAVEDNTFCWHDCRGPCLSCPSSSANKYSTDAYCGLISKADGPFSQCHTLVDPKMYMENCVFDVCVNGGFKKISCEAVQAYAETCQRAGVAIKDWRKAAGCPLQCSKDSSYNLCGKACPATCQDPEGTAVCPDSCVETCQCNQGFVLSEGKCIPKARCGCSYNGFTYAPNQAFWNDTVCKQRCVCNEKTQKIECTNSPCTVQEECAVRKGIQNCYPRSFGVCTASGDPHQITFDGVKYDFQGTCVYLLTGLCNHSRGLTDFQVWVRNQNRGNNRVSYVTVVYMKTYGMEIEASRQYPNKVMINKKLTNLPFMSDDGRFSFYRNPCSAVFSFDNGVKITFDYNSIVRVTVPSTYANALCGLCGNFNGVAHDDLTPKDGLKPTDPTTFCKSWKVQEVYRCRDDGSAVCTDLSSEEKRQKDGASECGVLMSPKGPFRDCHSLVNPEPYFKSCVYDHCILQKRQAIYCSEITSYVMACQDAGGTVHPWRSQKFCPLPCPAHSSYEVCADSCPVTCNGLSRPEGCDGNCTEGCMCNNGFILSGDQCVPISECGCNFNGVYYSSGESFYDDLCSQKCSCAEGGVSCAPSQCSSTEECRIEKGVRGCFPRGSATCIAAGHSRYRTFDNQSFSFGGQCSYVLAQSSNMEGKDLTPFIVTVTHEKRGSGPGSIRSVTCEVYQRNLTLNQGEKGIIQVNGVNSLLPVTLQSGNIRVEDNGQGRTISVDGGILVRFNNQGNSLSVTVPSNYMNSISGLGGNYNGIAEDDVGKTSEEITVFGNKWKVHREADEKCDGCGGSDNPCPSCQEEKKKIFLQPINCGIISDPSGPFANCHSKVNSETYVNDCVSDLCKTNGEDSSVLCTRVTMYADACKYAGVKDLTWRTDEFCPIICVPHSHYTTKADMCSTSCTSIYDTHECSDLYDEGCECDEGYVFDGKNCVLLEECGCFDNGRYYKANEIVLSDDCSLECTCDPISGLSCRNKSCAAGDQCQIVDGVRSCVNPDPCKFKICRAKETCQLQNGVARCIPDFTGTCIAWGDPHFDTFDDYNFDFQGTCSYTLSAYAGRDTTLQPFSVVIKNNNRQSQAVSYVKITDVTVHNVKLTVVNGEYPKIRINDEIINLPATFANGKLKVTQSGLTVSIEADCGLLVTSDWNWQTTVTIPSSYFNATSGLCGNFNQDANDEHKSPNGTQVKSIIDWAALWKVDSLDPFCFDHCPGQCPTCDEAKQQLYGSDNQCGIILRENGPFQECISKVNAVKYFKACLFDVCMMDGANIILCQSLETYASACLNQGVKLFDWRTPSNCPKICEDKNSHYNACGNACPASCFDRNAPAKCTKPCAETCECNTGMVLSAGECVSISNCGCQYNGRYYNPDQSWYNEKCNVQCKCDSSLGMVVCKEIKCKDSETCLMSNGVRACYPKKYTTCIASGGPHPITFDKKKIDFMGTCIYQLVGVTSQDPSLTNFTVKVRNEHRGNKAMSFTKEVTMEVYNITITMSTNHPQQIKVNGRLVNLPCKLNSKIICYKSGAHVIAKTNFDLRVSFDGRSYATVTLPSTYMGAVNGLCGNNNGDPSDDFNMKDGVEAKSSEEFGNHWKVGEVDRCTTICPGCAKCSEADKEPYRSDKYCGLLTKSKGPFSQCHDAIDPTTFFEDCLFDACAFKGRQSVVCNTIAAFVSECQKNGSMIKEWRTPSFCELTCPVNSQYKLLGDGCPVTCFGLTSPQTCVKSYTEGCYCNDGFMWSGDECVPMAECGCGYKNMYYKSGEEFFSGDLCKEKCTCGKNGKTSCQAHTCGINEECKVVDGILGCHAKEFGQCIAWGDLHYITFDQVYYDMQGTCSYILFNLTTEKVTFIVAVENEPYGNVAVTKSVTVTIGNHVIRLEREKAWSIEVNKERFHLPCQSQKYQFWINEEGNNVIIHTKYGITMLYDRLHFVSISVPSSFVGLPRGLCGNFNKNTKDELRLQNGTVVADLTVFAESWAVGELRSECRGCSGDNCFTCDEVTTAESQLPNKCGLIRDPQGPFKNCSALMSPEQFVKSCMFDVCASGAQQDALCASLQMYASWCQEKGVKIGVWRNIAGCPYKCPANSHYEVCTKTCDFTCNGLLAKNTCGEKCYEGCQCDDGFMFDGENCVTIDACGCNHYGRYLKANDIVMSDDCSQECTCNGEAGMSCRPMSCAEDENCAVHGGVRTCVKKDPCKMKTCHLKETCEVQEEKAVCVPDFTGTCLAWGDPHFLFFDGKNVDFQGTCSYILSEYSGSATNLEPYQIIIKNDNRGNTAASYVRKTEVNIYGIKISMEVGEFPQARVDGELTNLPATISYGKIKITRSGLTAVVETAAGVTATFDWNMRTTVTLPSSYYNVTSGLCGNFNQDPNDDQKFPNGTLATSTADWAALWKVYDRDPFCFDSCPGQCPTCEESDMQLYAAENRCGIVFITDGPFRDCIVKVRPEEFFDGCVYDSCMNDGAEVMLCQALESYAITCMSQGVKVYDWRTLVDCPKICEDPNSHYNACGNACPATCTDKGAPAKCRKPCVETCECNDNLVLSGDKCVPLTSCGCQHNGRYYKPHQSWYNEQCSTTCKCDPDRAQVVCQSAKCKASETCQIVNGVRGCYPKTYSTCIASGGPHYIMFDKKKIDFMGTCIYQLVGVTSQDPSLTNFTVKVKAVSFTKEVTMEVYNMTITMSTNHPQQIKVNGRLVNLPCKLNSKIICYKSGNHVITKTNFDLRVSFDGKSYATVTLPSTYMGAVNGLCGNNNGDPSDDFNMKDGVEAKSAEEFGNHWKVGEVDGCTTICPGCAKCSEADKEPYKSDKYCGLLTKPDGPFSQCHDAIDPTTFFKGCLFEACAFKGRQSVVCNTIAAYVSECQRNGSMIKEWRTPSFCELTCPVNSQYKLLGDGCPVTCFGLTSPQTCVKSYTEGCYCNDGFMWSGDECVPMAECGCGYKNMYYRSGEEFFSDDLCQEKCTCGKNGKTSCQAHTCGINEECKVVDGILGCHAKEFGQCIAWGDLHYITFDQVYYDMQGTCSYILFNLTTEKVIFIVAVENEPYGNVAVTKSVTVTIGNHVIRLEREKAWSIEVNKERFHLPCQSQKYQFRINEEGNNVIIHTKYGITMLYDRLHFVSISVPSSFVGLPGGLCGNFNKNTKDELRLKNGTVVADLTVFAESWAVGELRSECRGCSGDNCFTCDEVTTAESQSPNKCGLIRDPQGPFKNCSALMSPEQFVKSCMFDVCASGAQQDALCASLQMYASWCQEKGVKIGVWRNIAGCPYKCPANSHYEVCTKTCDFTCNGLLAKNTCGEKCYEGCQCDDGFMFDGENCVTIDACGCNHYGRYLKANDIVMSDDCSLECTCNGEAGMSCRPMSCAEDENCAVHGGVRTCVKKDPCKMKTCHLKETCEVQEEKAVCVPDFTGTCLAWGDPHFLFFDGKNVDFQGTCSYILSEYSGSATNLEPYQIIIKNDNRGNTAASYVRKTEVNIYGIKISMEVGEFPQARVDGELTNLPATISYGKIKITRSGLTAVVETAAGVTATFDWNMRTTVTLPSSYYNVTSGLCGNFNQDPNDDQKFPNGTLATSTADWAALWKVYDRDPFCFDSCPGQCPTCEESDMQLYAAENRCGIVFITDGPFRDCIVKVRPEEFFDGCVYDSCMNDGAEVMLCQALESYAITCMSQGVKVYDWRTLVDCPKICEDPNSHYNACGNACPATCTDKGAPAKCRKPCVETCECNDNLVLSGDKCVPLTSCGCQHNGRYYKPHHSWYNEQCSTTCKCDPDRAQVVCQSAKCKASETCQIVNGVRGCYPKTYSTCIASGGPHYIMFDKKKIDFMGTCIYQLVGVTSQDPSLTNFTVKVRNEHRGNKAMSFTKEVTMEVYNMTITMSTNHPQQIKVNGRLVNLPCKLNSKIICYKSGNHVVAKTNFDLRVSFDGKSYATVTLPSTYMGAVNGLCGNNNGDPSDDFNMKDGVEAKSAEEFGNHWKVGEVDRCTTICPGCAKCSEADKEPYKSNKYCGLLTKPDGPFSQCHDAIDPTTFFKDCLFDACAFKGRQSVVCNTIAAYVSECQRNGSMIKEWRTPSFCELTCPVNSQYKLLGDGCPVTCFGLTSPQTCVKSYTEGCYCNDGFMWSGDECVPMAECGCGYKNMYYKSGEEFFSDDLCQEKCTCGKNGKTSCQAHICGINEECKVVDGILGCHAKEFGQCIAWGGPHYITFDQLYFDMQGTCSYILFSLTTEKFTVIVTVENEAYGNVAVTKSVTVTIGNHVIRLERKKAWSIEVNGEQYNVPCRSPTQECWVNQEGNNIIIQTKYGITVLYDRKHFVSVLVPSSYAGQTRGLCGDYNKDSANDFRLPNGTVVADLSLFADSWTVARDGSTCRGCSGSQCPTCSEAATTEASSPSKCGMIADPQGPFKDCHAKASPDRYIKSCVFDICNGRGGQENLCASLQAYTALCQEKGAIVQSWRDIAGCPFTCPDNSTYSLCAQTCGYHCYDLMASTYCTSRCYEGCECNPRYVADGKQCVTMNHCGCVMKNGRYLKINESVQNENCTQVCTCHPEEGLTCHNWTCAKDEKCQLLEGVRSCVSTDPCKFKKCRLKETCKVQDDKAECVADYTGQCSAWGDPHFLDFDGKAYSFQGTCSYVLAEYSGSDTTLEPFRVVIKCDNRGSQQSSFVRRMEIIIYNTTISAQVGEFPKVQLNGEEANLPISLFEGKLTAKRSGLSCIMETKFMTATFDWNWHATVTISSSYYNAVSGLCGNFNQDPNDDQKLPNGTLVTSIIDWAAHWKVYDRDPFCFDSCPGQCPTCDESKKQLYAAENRCGIVFVTDGPFRDCIVKVRPEEFFDGCVYDSCMNDEDTDILCDTLETLTITCQSKGLKVYEWRTSLNCSKICEDKNSHYNACGNACPATCSDRNAPEKCTKPCVETCECNTGMVLSGGVCVSISNCGCQYNGRYYEPNESWTSEECTELCKCDAILGMVKCQEMSCKDSEMCTVVNGRRGCRPTGYSMCVVSGTSHHQTFDGRIFAYMSSCEHHLAKKISNDSFLADFTITAVNDRLGNKAVSFTVHNTTIIMSKQHPQQIQVDGLLTELPYYHSNEGRNLISAYSSGNKVVVKTDHEINVMRDGWNNVFVVMPSTYKGAVNGLCGNNNGEPSDDFTTADNRILENAEEFGLHWKVGDVEGCTEECSDCPKCSEVDKESYKSDKYCGLLIKSDGPLSQCHQAIDPIPFFKNCLSDACAYKGHQSRVCDSISTYVSECQRNGSQVKEWRTPSFCEWNCPSNSHYELSGNGCPSTCHGRTSPLVCEKSPTEGCYCNNDFIRSGQDCVPPAECGCVFGNAYYKLGQQFFLDGLCQKKCICGNHGITTCQAHTCGINEECKAVDGIRACHAKELGQCIAWGDQHYITFDKHYYDMQGTCSYILVKLQTDKITFVVIVEKEPYGNVAITKSVKVIIANHIIHMKRGRSSRIEVNGEQYNVPCRSPTREYWVNQEGNNVIIQTIHGFTVLFDGLYCVSVRVPSSYAGLTEGLCGNFNKNTSDDMRLSNGTVVTDMSLFAESWTAGRDGSTCRGCSGSQCPTCSQAATAEASSPTKCGMIADPQGPFKDCHELVPPEIYVKSCVFDACAESSSQKNLCASLQAYTAMCQEKGANIRPWRTIMNCSHSCPANSHYEVCVKTCKSTCNTLLVGTTCGDKCYEGCKCDIGYMFDGDKCVTADKCGCNLRGRYMKNGETVVTEDCVQRCTCQSGSLSCKNLGCAKNDICQIREGVRSCQPLASKCILRANRNFITFDGVSGQFPMDGSYVMSSSCTEDAEDRFMVVIETKKCSESIDGRTLQIFTSQGLISVNGQQIWINGWELKASRDLGNGSVKIQTSQSETTLELYNQITVKLNKSGEIQIIAKQKLSGKICGACGNFNRDDNDDLRLKTGEVSSDISFTIRSWIAKHFSPCLV